MRALVQRVRTGGVTVNGSPHSSIGAGLVVLLGVGRGDSAAAAEALAAKVAALRIFADPAGKMNLSVTDTGGSVLVVSQFTLYADTRRGHRPGFSDAAPPEEADALYRVFVSALRRLLGPDRVATGVFQAAMEVTIVNDGPVTILLDTRHPEPSPCDNT